MWEQEGVTQETSQTPSEIDTRRESHIQEGSQSIQSRNNCDTDTQARKSHVGWRRPGMTPRPVIAWRPALSNIIRKHNYENVAGLEFQNKNKESCRRSREKLVSH